MDALIDLRELRQLELEALHKELIEKLQYCMQLSQQNIQSLPRNEQAEIIEQLCEIERETTELALLFGIQEQDVAIQSLLSLA